MSYEGYREYLCETGHHFGHDCYDEDATECPYCGAPIAYWHSVDQTNGEDEDLPCTLPAPKHQVGGDDEWHVDHYGNRFANVRALWEPAGEWHTKRREPS